MIERKFIADNIKEFQIREFVKENVGRVGLSDVKLKKTPLGEKIIISASRPGLVVGRGGSNISKLTKQLKAEFELDNPQIEIEEVKDIGSDANIIAELIAGSLERYGPSRFKGVGHKAMSDVLDSGAIGVEILINGKIPGSRARNWRFYQGYLKKCGEISISGVDTAYATAKLKTGVVGIKVSIMPSDIKLPDDIKLVSELQESVEELEGEEAKKAEEDVKEKTKNKEKKDSKKKDESNKKSKKEKKASTKDKKEDKEKVKEEGKDKKEPNNKDGSKDDQNKKKEESKDSKEKEKKSSKEDTDKDDKEDKKSNDKEEDLEDKK